MDNMITIVSTNYFDQITGWAPDQAIISFDFVQIPKSIMKESNFEELIEDIILSSNEVIGKSDKRKKDMRLMMKDYRYMITESMEEFLEEESYMNLDGFIKFRLWEYSHVVNLILYAIMKKELHLFDMLDL